MSTRPSHIVGPVCGMIVGAVAHNILPRGIFGAYDTVLRASLVGVIAASAALFGLLLSQKRNSKP